MDNDKALLMAKDFVRIAQDYSFDTAVERISSRLIAERQAQLEAERKARETLVEKIISAYYDWKRAGANQTSFPFYLRNCLDANTVAKGANHV